MYCRATMWALAAIPLLTTSTLAQGFAERERKALAEPFVGITTNGKPERGLFAIRPSGADMASVRNAANALLASLSGAQRGRAKFKIDDIQWRQWINIHRFPRQGVSLNEMTAAQRRLIHDLLRASLSAKGYETSRDIMRLNQYLGELISNLHHYGEFRYWIAVMGEPSATNPWGWQLEGHHLIINFFVLGDQIVMTPAFMGSEPVSAKTGKYAGTIILQDEQNTGLALMRSMNADQQRAAHIGALGRFGENVAEAYKDNIVLPFEGIPATQLSANQRAALVNLIALYVGNMRELHAKAKMEEVRKHLDRTYFAWKGDAEPDSVFYYRIHSPVILIEFDHAGTIALDGPRGKPTRRHIHTVVRTPNGNDYGKDLLRLHYQAHKHEHRK
ncbi:MAG: DUF3500 domain-containing protein [Hyphomicrobiaceae bacterium]